MKLNTLIVFIFGLLLVNLTSADRNLPCVYVGRCDRTEWCNNSDECSFKCARDNRGIGKCDKNLNCICTAKFSDNDILSHSHHSHRSHHRHNHHGHHSHSLDKSNRCVLS